MQGSKYTITLKFCRKDYHEFSNIFRAVIFRKLVQNYTGVLPVVSVKASQKNVDSITASFLVKAGVLLSFFIENARTDLFRFISRVHAVAHTNV